MLIPFSHFFDSGDYNISLIADPVLATRAQFAFKIKTLSHEIDDCLSAFLGCFKDTNWGFFIFYFRTNPRTSGVFTTNIVEDACVTRRIVQTGSESAIKELKLTWWDLKCTFKRGLRF